MSDNEELTHIENILKTKTRELNILQEQAARLSVYTPPHITMRIEDLQHELSWIRAELKRLRELEGDSPAATTPNESPRPSPRPTIGRVRTVPVIFALIGLVLVAALGAVFAASGNRAGEPSPTVTRPVLLSPTIEPMPAVGVNIAVAEFTPLTDNALVSTEDGRQLRDDLVAVMQATLADMSPSLRRGGVRATTTITGTDPATREANASRLAQALNATIVLYGRIAPQANGVYLVYPEFYVSPTEQGFKYGEEIRGSIGFGEPVQFSPPLNAPGLADVNAELKARIEALQDIVKGLAAFGAEEDADAYRSFESARESIGGYSSGQEVLELLLGAVKLRQYRRLSGQEPGYAPVSDSDLPEKARKEAERHFAQGLALNKDYARLNLGMGGVALALATEMISPTSVIWPDGIEKQLQEARSWYAKALPAPVEQSPFGYVPAKARFGVAQTYMGEYRYYLQKTLTTQEATKADEFRQFAKQAYAEAITNFKEVVSKYREASQPAELMELAGSAQAMIAELELIEADYLDNKTDQPAKDLYRQAVQDCDEGHQILRQDELEKSQLALYYRVQCFNVQSLAYARLDDPDAAETACEHARTLNDSKVMTEELACTKLIQTPTSSK